MPEVGQTSHTAEEEECRDIPVDTERLIGYAPVAPVQSESDEDEDARADTPEPVIGGVFRFGDDDEGDDDDHDDDDEAEEAGRDGAEEAAEVDPEEGPEELAVEPAGYHDDMGTTSDDIIEELTTHTAQLEDRIAHLEEQNTVHQEREDQYRDLAYQREAENAELRQQLQQLQQERTTDSHRMICMGEDWARAEARADRLRAERDFAHMERQTLVEEMLQIRADRDAHYAEWRLAATRATDLEAEVRDSAARVDRAGFALDTAFNRLRNRVRRYPHEGDISRRSIARRRVDIIARQEHGDAIFRGGLI